MRDDLTDAKARGDSVLKNLEDGLQEAIFQFLRRNTQAKTLEWLQETHGIALKSGATLTEFFRWYRKSRHVIQAKSAADELAEAVTKLPEMKVTAAQAREIAQANFEILANRNQDAELFAMLSAGEEKRERLRLEREKFEWSKKTDIERALDVLAEELGENDEARRHYEAMKASLAKGGGQ
jgi:hypothetical protein